MRDQDADCVAKPCCTSRCCNSMGHGPFAIPGQGGMLIGYARVSTQETREQSPEKRRRTPLTTFWAAETQLGEPPHCVRSRLRRMQAPQRSSETPRLACKIAPICLIPLSAPKPSDGSGAEAACLAFLQRVRWRESFRCPRCAGSEAWLTNTGHLKCRKCRRRTSLTAGTIFERTQKPLRV